MNHQIITGFFRRPVLQAVFFFILTLFVSGCLDDNIEGASSTASSGPFKALKATSSFTTVNNCSGSTATTFLVKIDLQGTGLVYDAYGTYKFSTQTSTTSVSYNYTQTGGGSSGSTNNGFRAVNKSTATTPNFITVTHCVRFGTSTSVEYTYDLTTVAGDYSTISLVIPKPAGAQ